MTKMHCEILSCTFSASVKLDSVIHSGIVGYFSSTAVLGFSTT